MSLTHKKDMADWTPDRVDHFWEYWSSNPYVQDQYFSFRVGRGITYFLKLTGRLKGQILDYGCGPGYLLSYLLEQPVICSGCDTSQTSIEMVNQKFQGRPNWTGAMLIPGNPTPYPAATFDVVTCVETIEHLTDDVLKDVVSEVRRLVRPGGIALFTTPHAENLDASAIYCPFCQAEFHRVQHIRSFTSESLRILLENHGFEVIFCQNVAFYRFQRALNLTNWRYWNVTLLYHWLRDNLNRLLDTLSPKPFPQGREFRRRAWPGDNLCAVVVPKN